MIVMEKLNNFELLYKKPKDEYFQYKEEIKKALNILHDNNYVHGDFRNTNIAIVSELSGKSKIMLLDFDWSGEENKTNYPYFMNHEDIKWPDGASDGKPLKKQHDIDWFKTYFP